jgi:ABC-2 type transport system permease protein
MWPIFKRAFFKNTLMILGWGLGLALLGYYMFTLYDSFFEQSINLNQMIQALPEGFLAFFGEDVNPLTARGFLTLEFFSYIPVILGILVVSQAAKLIRSSEETGTLEIILAQPVSRSLVYWGRFLALVLSLVVILVMTWGGFALGLQATTEIDLLWSELILPFISLLAILFLFLALTFMFSMFLSSNAAGLVSGFFLIASYFVSSLTRLDDDLEVVNHFSPFKYYQSGQAIDGLNMTYLLILAGVG